MPDGITRLRLIENRRELGSPKDNGAFLLPRWPGTIGKSDSVRLRSGFFISSGAEVQAYTEYFLRDLIGNRCLSL